MTDDRWAHILRWTEKWLKPCIRDHPDCPTNWGEEKLPTRVIDVGPPDGSKEPYLFVPKPSHVKWRSALYIHPGTIFQYTTLSYCRGKTQHFITTIDNLAEMRKPIPWNLLPKTIRDAITLTRRLNVRYLWVDALCIIQDSSEYWERELGKMAEIYGGSLLTIAAASAADVWLVEFPYNRVQVLSLVPPIMGGVVVFRSHPVIYRKKYHVLRIKRVTKNLFTSSSKQVTRIKILNYHKIGY
jgi:hypothetical protein